MLCIVRLVVRGVGVVGRVRRVGAEMQEERLTALVRLLQELERLVLEVGGRVLLYALGGNLAYPLVVDVERRAVGALVECPSGPSGAG